MWPKVRSRATDRRMFCCMQAKRRGLCDVPKYHDVPPKNPPCGGQTHAKEMTTPRKDTTLCSRHRRSRNTNDTQYRGVWGGNPKRVWAGSPQTLNKTHKPTNKTHRIPCLLGFMPCLGVGFNLGTKLFELCEGGKGVHDSET